MLLLHAKTFTDPCTCHRAALLFVLHTLFEITALQPNSAGRGLQSRITRGVAFKGTQVIHSSAAAGALTGYRHSVATK